MKKYKYILILPLMVLFFMWFNNINHVNAEGTESNFTNLIIFAKFQNEDEFINDIHYDSSMKEIVDNMYNNSYYSVKNYYQAQSYSNVNMNSIYLFTNDGSSITLSRPRSYYAKKTSDNPDGYENYDRSMRFVDLKEDWAQAINNALNNGAYLSDVTGTKRYDFRILDKNRNGYVDSINIIYKESPFNISVEHADPLWNYQDSYSGVSFTSGSSTIYSNRYVQVTLNKDPVYLDNLGYKIMNNASITHEMGHVFGLYDLYNSSNKTAVGYMSSMCMRTSPVAQGLSIKEREGLGWINTGQIDTITAPGEYVIYSTKDDNKSDKIGYKMDFGYYSLYLEYRNFSSLLNRFDNTDKKLTSLKGDKLPVLNFKSGLICYKAQSEVKRPNNSNSKPTDWQLEAITDVANDTTKNQCALYPERDDTFISQFELLIDVISMDEDKLVFEISGNGFKQTEKVNDILVEGIPNEIEKGKNYQLTAEIKGDNIYKNAYVDWDLQGQTHKNTFVDYNGYLVINKDETSNKFILIVSYKSFKKEIELIMNTIEEHDLVYYDKVEPSCDVDGKESHYKCNTCGKLFSDNTHTNEVFETNLIIKALGHNEVEIAGHPATCEESGLTAGLKCSRCDKVLKEQEIIPALGHSEVETVGYPATCEGTGLTAGLKCSRCDKLLKEQEEIPALGHNELEIAGHLATCEETGLTIGSKCSRCDKVLKEQEIIPALCHSEVEIAGHLATCEGTGLTAGLKCSRCDKLLKEQEEIPALGHNELEIAGHLATCEETGLTIGSKCSRCDKVLKEQEIIPALGHSEVEIVGHPATCEETGLTIGLKCSRCDKVLKEQEIIPALGHVESDWIIDSEATQDSIGHKHKECINCKKILVKEDIPLLVSNKNEVIIYSVGLPVLVILITGLGILVRFILKKHI